MGAPHRADLATFEFYPVNALVIDPASPATIYAAVGLPWNYDDFPIYKSVDGGGALGGGAQRRGPARWRVGHCAIDELNALRRRKRSGLEKHRWRLVLGVA